MSELNQPVANAQGAGEAKAPLVEPTADANAEAAQPSDRLLEESKRWKAQAQALKKEKADLLAKQEATERAEAERQQKYKELYEAERKAKSDLETKVVDGMIRSAVEAKAREAGCVNIDDLLRVADDSMLFFDKESSTVQGVEAFVEKAAADRAYFFKKGTNATINPTVPGGSVKTLGLTDRAKSMSTDELKAAIVGLAK